MNSSEIVSLNLHKQESREVLAYFGLDSQQGLNNTKIEISRDLYGKNILLEQRGFTLIGSVIGQLKNPLIVILILAVIATLILGEWVDSIVIGVAVVVNIIVALVQEGKADQAYKKLVESRHHEAVVVRNGQKTVVDSTNIVVGDVVMLEPGMFVPADIQVIESRGLRSDQALFTGESSPVPKNADTSNEESAFARNNMLFSGSTISAGTGQGVVVAVGGQTEFGTLADHLQTVVSDDSPVERSTKRLARIIGMVSLIVIVLIIAIGVYRGFSIYEILLLGIAIAVAAVPEGLASVVTVILAYGSQKIAKEGGLVKNLSAAQSLGSATIILTDKTGTLTHGNLEVDNVLSFTDSGDDNERVLETALLATDVFYDLENKRFYGDEMDVALVDHNGTKKDFELVISNYMLDSQVPFDSAHKFYAALRSNNKEQVLAIKGAFSVLWPACHKILENGVERNVTESDHGFFKRIHDEEAREGKRLVAVCYRKNPEMLDMTDLDSVRQNLVFCGFIVFADQMRESAPQAVKDARGKGVVVTMVTGDGPETARSIAFQSGITESFDAAVILGPEMEGLSDEALYQDIMGKDVQIFSRVSPSDKLRLASLLGERGEVVAMTGDGVNDAAALKKAAIGISLASATEVAKESSGLVLTNNSFSVIVYAITEGRRIVENIRKTIVYLLSTSFSEVFVIVGALLLALPIPFLPTHILWANLVEEGLMNFAYIFDPLQKKKRSNTREYRTIITAKLLWTTFIIALVNGFMFMLFFYFLITTNLTDEKLRSMMFAALSIDSIFTAMALRSLDQPIYKIPFFSNPFMLLSLLLSFGAFLAAIYVPIMRTLLHLEPFTVGDIGLVFLFGLFNLFVVEMVKFASHQHIPHKAEEKVAF